jgi:hypothetical protein
MSGLRSGAMVVPQYATKPFTANDLAGRLSDAVVRLDDLVVQRLMVSLRVIMLQKLPNCVAKHVLSEEDQSRKAFVLDALHESFNVRIQSGRPWREFYSLHAFPFEHLAEAFGELRVAIHQDVSFAKQEPVKWIREISGYLLHPQFSGIGSATGKVNAAGSQLHDEEEIERHQPALRPHLSPSFLTARDTSRCGTSGCPIDVLSFFVSYPPKMKPSRTNLLLGRLENHATRTSYALLRALASWL